MEQNRCPRCGNTDIDLFYQGSKGWYCRACIKFSRVLLSETRQENWDDYPADLDSEYRLNFELTDHQKIISRQICKQMKEKDVLVWAVTGAGKTELCMEFIQQCLNQKKRVAIVIARRQVVLELAERFRQAFQCKVIPVCEGYTRDVDGDLLIMTAHQCYRFFEKKFDHIIVDEPDAFPYDGNPVLQGIVRNSCKGTMLYLSATPDSKLLENCHVLQLFSRPHGCNLPVPVSVYCLPVFSYFYVFCWVFNRVKQGIPFLIFVPTIKDAHRMTVFLKCRFNVKCCTSKTKDKDGIITKMKQKKISGMICTTILERGVTFEGIDVCVWNADHLTFSSASLIQIAGRVGRKASRPDGDCLFLCFSRSRKVDESIQMINYANNTKMSIMSSETQ